MGNQMTSITLFGTTYELPVIKDEKFESLQTAIREHREVLSVDEKKRGILGLFAKKESLSAEERLRRMESLVTHYDELINLLRLKISACRQVFEAIGDGVEAEFLRKLDTLEKLEKDRQRLAANFIKAGHGESAAVFEEQRQNIRNMVTNLSRSAILILKKLRHALDALETLASNDEKQRMVYENLKNDVGLYRQYYDFNQKMAAVQQEIAQLTNIALEFDNILRDNLGPLGILVDQISQIDSRLSESLVEIEKLSAELEKGNTSTEALSLVSDRLVSSIISGRMRSDVISDILEQLRNSTSDTDQIDFNLKLAESVSDELDFAALAENMRILVKTGIHYGDAKAEAERLVGSYAGKGAFEATVIRPANVTGPGSVWVREILDVMHKGPFPLMDGGKWSASLVYVENLVDGILAAMDAEAARGRTYNLRDDYRVTWGEYLRWLAGLVGKKPAGSLPFGLAWKLGWIVQTLYLPFNARPPITAQAVGIMGRDLDISNRRAKEELGWSTRVSWDEARSAIERWVREEYKPPR